ncbi:hypothetical protein HDU83_001848 [Entophlyctis luteolus]|nr:hypothetical protein HDU83_001848 [Entophlyctis luteolus]
MHNFMTNTAPAILQVQEDADSDALQPQPRPAAFFPAAAAGYLRVADDDADKDPVPSSSLTDDTASAPAIVTKYLWKRVGTSDSTCQLDWSIGETVPAAAGVYRFSIYFAAKPWYGQTNFVAHTGAFTVA